MSEQPESTPAGLNVAFIEDMYESYLRDPDSVSQDWIQLFESYNGEVTQGLPPKLGPSFKPSSVFNPPALPVTHDRPSTKNLHATATCSIKWICSFATTVCAVI